MSNDLNKFAYALVGALVGSVLGAISYSETVPTPVHSSASPSQENSIRMHFGEDYNMKSGVSVSASAGEQCKSFDGIKRGVFVTIKVKNGSQYTIDPTTTVFTHPFDMKGNEAPVEASEYHKDMTTSLAPGSEDFSKMCYVGATQVARITLDNTPLVEWSK